MSAISYGGEFFKKAFRFDFLVGAPMKQFGVFVLSDKDT